MVIVLKSIFILEYNNERRNLLKKLRRTLNQQVKKLNDDVYKVREIEFNLKNKERALRHLAHGIQKYNSKRISTGNLMVSQSNLKDELNIIYQNYKDLDFRYKSPLIKEDENLNTMENKMLSDRESREFYGRWKGVLENQLSIDAEESEQDYDRDDFLSKLPQQYIEKPKPPKTNNYVESNGPGYSYDNLIRMMDLQLKAKAKVPDNPIIQKHISQSLEQRYKVKMVFSEHAQWLKNMKGQVNFFSYITY
jgi:hypothetical protein